MPALSVPLDPSLVCSRMVSIVCSNIVKYSKPILTFLCVSKTKIIPILSVFKDVQSQSNVNFPTLSVFKVGYNRKMSLTKYRN